MDGVNETRDAKQKNDDLVNEHFININSNAGFRRRHTITVHLNLCRLLAGPLMRITAPVPGILNSCTFFIICCKKDDIVKMTWYVLIEHSDAMHDLKR